MDLLVKKNIIKKNKVIIDIGHKYIKLLGVTYANNKITVTGSYIIDAVPFFFEEELINYREIVRQINDVINRKKLIRHGEISLSIPSNMVEYRIGSAKNIKLSELGKIIKSNIGLNKVNEITHNIDWSYLGQAEKNSDTQTYYLVAAVNKSVLTPLINEFENKNLRVTTVSFSQNNIIGFSEIFGSDFDNPNKLYLDFGMNDTNVIVESSGTAIYSRTIDIGFNTFVDKVFSTCEGVSIPEIIELIRTVGIKKENYPVAVVNEENYFEAMERINLQWQNEIIRIIRLCENEGVEISKIVCVNTPLLGQLDSFTENDITVDYFPPEETTEFSCAGYSINLDESEDYSNFGNSIGLAMATMQNDKRLNLLSTEQKEKHINKYLMYGFGGIFAILLLIMLVTYINLGFSNLSLNKLQKEDTQYKQKVSQIKTAEDSLKKNDEFISTYDSLHFPFADLMKTLELNKPYGLTIISVDSMDRLIQLVKKEGETAKSTTTPDTKAETSKITTLPEEELPKIKYVKDLAGEKLSIRGYSSSPAEISQFIFDLSKQSYITDLELKAIEQKVINGTDTINVFEVVLTVGGVKN